MILRVTNWLLAPLAGAPKAREVFFRLLKWLVAVDVLFLAAYLTATFLYWSGVTQELTQFLNIEVDGSLPEVFGYAKWSACIVFLLLASRRHHDWALLAWALIFVGVLHDDANSVHERAGDNIIIALNLLPSLGLPAVGLGQLIAFGVMGLFAAILAAVGITFGGQIGRDIAVRYLALVAGLIFFGVGGDAVHEAVSMNFGGAAHLWLLTTLTAIEDGGEMIMASICTAFAVAIYQLAGRT